MKYIADLHVHSHFSIATSKFANLEGYCQWARVKGIQLLGTGDFTHPGWFKEIREKLEPAEPGLYKLKSSPPPPSELEGLTLPASGVRFCLSAEISSIYKKGEKTRKVHSLIFAPDMDTAARINARLDVLGNIRSDGRPILGLDPKSLLEILLEISTDAFLIPAHIWTPWFSLFGSKSGFDDIQECFEELTSHIFAMETGLSSDPPMNWRWSALDPFTLVSHSDAHSPRKLGREADLFDTDLSYPALFEALKTRKGFLGTLEFYPEEGKYHLDGHRKCNIRLNPEETAAIKEICPVCGGRLTVGVMSRVMELADRPPGFKPAEAAGFRHLIPLPELLSEILGSGSASKKVLSEYRDILNSSGDEFTLLLNTPIEDIRRKADPILAEGIRRMREGEIYSRPGYDGEFGVIRVFQEGELESMRGQGRLFDLPDASHRVYRDKDRPLFREKEPGINDKRQIISRDNRTNRTSTGLNREQEAAVTYNGTAALVSAGPGTGKTRTLIGWIKYLIRQERAKPNEIVALTFTNKAAKEMKERLDTGDLPGFPGSAGKGIKITTFHSLCFELLSEMNPDMGEIYDGGNRISLIKLLRPDMSNTQAQRSSRKMERILEGTDPTPDGGLGGLMSDYRKALEKTRSVDISELVTRLNLHFDSDPPFLKKVRERFRFIGVDEFQDINPAQYRFLSNLFPPIETSGAVFAIGDPDQAIYGFRGSDVRLFSRFACEYHVKRFTLSNNYRCRDLIARAGSAVIGQNQQREQTPARQGVKTGGKITVVTVEDPAAEAHFIAGVVEELIGGSSHISVDSMRNKEMGSYAFSDIAVLCRTRAVRDELIQPLINSGIPLALGEHSSIALLPAFSYAVQILRLISNPGDIIAVNEVLKYVLGTDMTAGDRLFGTVLFDLSVENRSFLPLSALRPLLDNRQTDKLKDFSGFLDILSKTAGKEGAAPALACIFERDERKDDPETGLKKEMLIEEAREFGTDLKGFLKRISLNPFESEGGVRTEKVRLLTFHSAKGLEFPIVFIAGAEEGITPLLRKDSETEEERRLFYVAMTRAMDRLYISSCTRRKKYGAWTDCRQSRFFSEIPSPLREDVTVKNKRVKQLELF